MRFAVSFCAVLFALAGCATVDPGADYARVGELLRDPRHAHDVYDPALEHQTEMRVDQLLANGLNLEEAIQIALLNNRELQAKFLEIGVARAELVQSGLFSNPMVSLAVQLPEGGGRTRLIGGFAQEIVDFWQIPVRKHIAGAELERVILAAAQDAIELAADVEAQVYRTVALEQSIPFLETALGVHQRRLESSRSRTTAGEMNLTSINKAQQGLFQAQVELVALKREVQSSRLTLMRLMGVSQMDAAFTFKAELPEIDSEEINESFFLEEAVQSRFDARAAAQSVIGATAEIERQCLRRFPSVTAGLEFDRKDRRSMPGRNIPADTARASLAEGALTAPDIESRAVRQRARRQEIDFMMGPSLAMTLPIWDQNQAQIAAAQYRLRGRMKEYEGLLDRISFEVRTAVNSILVSQEQAALYRDQILPLAEAEINIARSRLAAGSEGIMILLDAEESVLNLKRGYLAVQRDYAVALTDLDRAVGRRLRNESSSAGKTNDPNASAGSTGQ